MQHVNKFISFNISWEFLDIIIIFIGDRDK